ncbi:MAG: SCO family protein [Sulfurifustis sp.]
MRNLATLCILLWTNVAAAHVPAEVGFEQRLGASVPLNLAFRDATGRVVALDDYFHRRPVLLTLVYYHCPNLCSTSLTALTDAIVQSGLNVGRDLELVVLSIDPRERAAQAAKTQRTLMHQSAGRGGIGSAHFLTGDADSIAALARAIGFRYDYDAASDEYVHPAGAVVLTRGRRVSRYLYGAPFDPSALRAAVADADASRIGAAIERVWLRCFHYDPVTGRYSAAILDTLRVFGALMLLALAFGFRRLRRRNAAADDRSQ